ncbi:MAG: mitochondrial carrier domain-containing protein [Podila humilis]|nr:MAG: mitochondrial carrier domain-containing protein [Podila humilis]
MPSDPLVNLTTSGAAAFCARVCVHPLDHLKASLIDTSRPIRARVLDHLRHLDHYLHSSSSSSTSHYTLSRYRGLYQGVSFALLIQVPALAFFLSTYDATKHTLAHVAHTLHLPCFHLHHAETHLASGAMAKVAGTILWAPQQLLQGLHQVKGQLSIGDAVLLAKKVCREQGVKALWTGYQKSLMVLLPYTAVYFAAYEKLKQLARRHLLDEQVRLDPTDGKRDQEELLYPTALQGLIGSTISKDTLAVTTAGRGSVFQNSREYSLQLMETTPTPLNLGTYMVCVAGAVAISATICHTASAITSHVMVQMNSASVASTAPAASTSTPITTHTARLMLAQTPTTTTAAQTHLATTLRQNQQAHLTTSTTASIAEAASLRLHMKQRQIATTALSPASVDMNKTKRALKNQGGLRSLTRGLGPRIMWTAPGVTLTTAGFEVFRNMALGVA